MTELLEQVAECLGECQCLGLIGVGKLGEQLRELAQKQGWETELCDPPRSLEESEDISEEFFQLWGNGMGGCEMTCSDVESFVPMDVLARRCDAIAVQVPLTSDGNWPTAGMITGDFLSQCRKDVRILCLSDPRVVEDNLKDDPRIRFL